MASFFASRLAPFADVTLIGSWREQIDAMNAHGLTVTELNGEQRLHRVRATDDPASAFPVDVAIVLTKSYQSEISAERAAGCLTPDGIAITLQNGLGNLEPLQSAVGINRATAGVTSIGATLLRPGHVRHAGNGSTSLGQLASPHPSLQLLAKHLTDSGLDASVTDNVASLLWGKVAINAGINPLTALLNVPNGYLATDPTARAIMQTAAQEAAAVADALQIPLPYNNVVSEVLRVAQATAQNRSSMLQDITRGAPTEVDAICGVIVQAGEKLAVEVPMNTQLYEMVVSAEIAPQSQLHNPFFKETILAILANTLS